MDLESNKHAPIAKAQDMNVLSCGYGLCSYRTIEFFRKNNLGGALMERSYTDNGRLELQTNPFIG